MYLHRNDVVEVITGVDKGSRGRVLAVIPGNQRVIVEGVKRVWKHVRPSQRNPQGGRIQVEMPVEASNVMLVCPNRDCPRYDRPVRVKSKLSDDGVKIRVCAKCGSEVPKVL